MRTLWLRTVAACLLFCSLWSAAAQKAEITVDSKPTPAEVRSWLAGDDQRLVAWGAYFAGKQNDDGEATLLLRRVLSWTAPPEQPSETKRHREYAMRNVLDALIQRREAVSVEGIKAIANSFPEQAMILASRLPVAETAPLLMEWYGDGGSSDWAWRPRVAAMMLAKAPPQGFAASVLSQSEEKLTVSVIDDNSQGSGFGTSFDCGASPGKKPPQGWPPEFTYVFAENSWNSEEPVLVIAGGDRITYFRMVKDDGNGPCLSPRGLSDETRHHLIAEMLGESNAEIAWETKEAVTIRWTSARKYKAELASLIAEHEARLQQTADTFADRGLITTAECVSGRPRLLIVIFDNRKLRNAKLPILVLQNPRTAFESPA